jgi:type VI secretion system protein ImpF
MNHNAMTFDIEADLWADPLPLHMYMKTEIDLEIGEVQVSEFSARSIR